MPDRGECLQLLAAKSVGRITYCIEGGARILPVNYILANDSIIFRTVPDGEIYCQALSSTCAFEIDETDDFLEWGWSVVVVGRLQLATENDFAQMHYSKLADPWAAGNCQHHQFAWKCGVETAARGASRLRPTVSDSWGRWRSAMHTTVSPDAAIARPASSSSTKSPHLVSGAPSGMKSPTRMPCSSGTMRFALGQLRGKSSRSTQRAVVPASSMPARASPNRSGPPSPLSWSNADTGHPQGPRSWPEVTGSSLGQLPAAEVIVGP